MTGMSALYTRITRIHILTHREKGRLPRLPGRPLAPNSNHAPLHRVRAVHSALQEIHDT